MQSPQTYWQWNDLTEELSDFQRGTVIGCHLSNKSVRQMCLRIVRKHRLSSVATLTLKFETASRSKRTVRQEHRESGFPWLSGCTQA